LRAVARGLVGSDRVDPRAARLVRHRDGFARDLRLHALESLRLEAVAERHGEERDHLDADRLLDFHDIAAVLGLQARDVDRRQAPGGHHVGLGDAKLAVRRLQARVVHERDAQGILGG